MANIIVLFEVTPTKEGRKKLFESYKITVCSEIRSYTDKDRSQAPQDSNEFFEV